MELDICDLDKTIQEFGGMRNEVEKKKWAKVADTMNIPKMVGLFVKLVIVFKKSSWFWFLFTKTYC